jgi:phosphoribosyl-ATP pyrophosphohydrolase/phosphoribosyl-AMP cyclohydrolase
MLDLSILDFEKNDGLVTVITQDDATGAVLMVGYINRQALEKTLATGEMHYFSQARGLWHKGATSGHTQKVVSLAADCDGDALLARVVPRGPACHTGSDSCFVGPSGGDALAALDATIAGRAAAPAAPPKRPAPVPPSSPGEDRAQRLKKLKEEAAALIADCADADRQLATEEVADLLYHALVALRAAGGSLSDVQRVLATRATPSSLRRIRQGKKS